MRWKNCFYLMAVLLVVILMTACARYERQVVPFKMPTAYPNATEVAGAQLAAKSYDDSKDAQAAFGFDIRGAGILPVQVIFDNKGAHSIEIIPEQTFLVDTENNLWSIIDASLAYDRISKKTELGKVLPEAGKSGLLAGAAGAIIGAAIGIVTGHNVGDAVMKGAAVGTAAGLVSGGAKGLADPDVQYQIREDLKNNSLERRAIKPHEIAHGFIFFPGESKKAKELRLQLRTLDTGQVYSLTLIL
jgi:hypothetical protein